MARDIDKSAENGIEFTGAGGVIRVVNKTYAVGLVWESLETTKNISKTAKQAARNHGADLFCIRKPSKNQYGLGSTKSGHQQKMPPLAAFLTEVMDGSFVAAFDVGGGRYYLVAAREDMVLAGHDRIITNKEEAIEIFHELLVGSNWNQAICPKDWEIDGTKQDSLENIIVGIKSRTRLESIYSAGYFVKIAGLASVVILVVGVVALYEKHEADLADEDRARSARERAELEARLLAERNKFVLPAMPWEGNPSGVPTINSCVKNILLTHVDIPGWNVTDIKCTLHSAEILLSSPERPVKIPAMLDMSMLLERSGGTINWVAEALNKNGFHPSIIEEKGGKLNVTWSVPAPPSDYGPENKEAKNTPAAPGNVDKADKYLVTQFDEIFSHVELKKAEGASVTIPQGKGTPQHIVVEKHLSYAFKTTYNPIDFSSILKHIPAILVSEVDFNPTTWTWLIEGSIYERYPVKLSSVGKNFLRQ